MEGYIQIQLWQILGDGSNILYAHGLIDQDSLMFNHFDLAVHHVNPQEIPAFIHEKARLKLINKDKYLRLDGGIRREHVFDMIRLFFPLDYLVDEYTETTF